MNGHSWWGARLGAQRQNETLHALADDEESL
jgi:hypothetical protein